MKYLEPETFAKSFTCPHCGVLSKQDWWGIMFNKACNANNKLNPIRVGTCQNCEESTIWVNDKMFFPDFGTAPAPNPDMPDSVLKLYREATAIHTKSPRGAAALIRLAIQILCKELGESGQNINADIKSLVEKGLPPIVQKSLDVVRVTGNDAVHPGQIDTDDPQTVGQLFELVNIIVDYMIALPNKVSGIYDSLPVEKLNGIEQRDKKKIGSIRPKPNGLFALTTFSFNLI